MWGRKACSRAVPSIWSWPVINVAGQGVSKMFGAILAACVCHDDAIRNKETKNYLASKNARNEANAKLVASLPD